MTKAAGQDAVVKIDNTDGGSLSDISAYVSKISGLPSAEGLVDVTTFGQLGHKYHGDGLEAADISLDLVWDNTASTGPDAIFASMRNHVQTRSFSYSPDAGTTTYTCEVWLESYDVTSSVGDVVKATARLKVDGQVSRA